MYADVGSCNSRHYGKRLDRILANSALSKEARGGTRASVPLRGALCVSSSGGELRDEIVEFADQIIDATASSDRLRVSRATAPPINGCAADAQLKARLLLR